jgi:hypothetical protein
MKVGKEKKNCSIFLSTYWNSSFKSGDLKTKSFKIWVVYVIFSVIDPLYRLKLYIFKTLVIPPLQTFHKPGPMSLIQYVFIGKQKAFKCELMHVEYNNHSTHITCA